MRPPCLHMSIKKQSLNEPNVKHSKTSHARWITLVTMIHVRIKWGNSSLPVLFSKLLKSKLPYHHSQRYTEDMTWTLDWTVHSRFFHQSLALALDHQLQAHDRRNRSSLDHPVHCSKHAQCDHCFLQALSSSLAGGQWGLTRRSNTATTVFLWTKNMVDFVGYQFYCYSCISYLFS